MAVPRMNLAQAPDRSDEDSNGLIRSPTSCTRRDRLGLNVKVTGSTALGDRTGKQAELERSIVARLMQHKRDNTPDQAAKELFRDGIRQNRFCRALEEELLDRLIESMEYFVFSDREDIIKQGNPGRYFFVLDMGHVEVFANGALVNCLSRGSTFGGIALLYNCPRTATVTVKQRAALWGVDGNIFRSVLKEHGQRLNADNRQFLEGVHAFQDLPERQKHRLAEMPLVLESYDRGARVCNEGEVTTAIYFVKKGELDVIKGGSVCSDGKLSGGEKLSTIVPGDVFGVKSVLYNQLRSTSVVAASTCELVCIGVKTLREVLGADVGAGLQRSFVGSILRQVPFVSHLTLSQRSAINEAMYIASYEPGVRLPDGLLFALVVDGSLSSQGTQGRATMDRSEWCLVEDLASITNQGEVDALVRPRPEGLVVGDRGAVIATLSRANLVTALEDIGAGEEGGGRPIISEHGALDQLRKVVLAKRVALLRELSEEQILNLVNQFRLETVRQGQRVIEQGEIGDTFYLLSRGEVNVIADAMVLKTLRPGDCFGERALVLEERRSASVEVVSEVAELWVADKATFSAIITENMRQTLVNNIRLQGTTVTLKSLVHERFLGKGGFGSVRLVKHKYTAMRYALKRVKIDNDQVAKDTRRECEILESVNHAFLLRLIRTFETRDSIYILTELITGGSLYEQMGRMGVFTRKQAQFYIGALVLVMEVVHERNIAYRDLKPENIMLDQQGYPKLIDFGLAKMMTDGPRTYTLLGTVFYMAPEVILGKGYGMDVDIWSLGVMMYEMVCGRLPFGDGYDEDHEILASVIQDGLIFPSRYNDSAGKKLMQGLLQKNPEQRLGSGLEGWEPVKNAKFFSAGTKGKLFYQIAGRELPAPVIPKDDQFVDEQELLDLVTASDAEQLAD